MHWHRRQQNNLSSAKKICSCSPKGLSFKPVHWLSSNLKRSTNVDDEMKLSLLRMNVNIWTNLCTDRVADSAKISNFIWNSNNFIEHLHPVHTVSFSSNTLVTWASAHVSHCLRRCDKETMIEFLGNTNISFFRHRGLFSFGYNLDGEQHNKCEFKVFSSANLTDLFTTLRNDKLHKFSMFFFFFVSFRFHLCSFYTWFGISLHKWNTPNHPQICINMMQAMQECGVR